VECLKGASLGKAPYIRLKLAVVTMPKETGQALLRDHYDAGISILAFDNTAKKQKHGQTLALFLALVVAVYMP
jgi:hypothetical protein